MATSIQDKAEKMIADAYFGENAVIGDGTILKMLMELFAGLIGNCPLGAKQAHRRVNSPFAFVRKGARDAILWQAYLMTNDKDEANKMADVGMAVGAEATADEFVKFAKP